MEGQQKEQVDWNMIATDMGVAVFLGIGAVFIVEIVDHPDKGHAP